MNMAVVVPLIILGIVLIGVPVWFVCSLKAIIKEHKDKTKPDSSGLWVNFVFSCIGLVFWLFMVLAIVGFFILGMLIVQNM